jgi:hypothetical protein
MGLRRAVLTLLLFTAGCADAARLTEASALKPGPALKNYAWAEDRYPTEEEFATYGGESSATATYPRAGFSGSGNEFTASSEVKFTQVNNASASLSVSLVNTEGKEVNSSEAGYENSMYRPFDYGPHTITASVDAALHKCGVTGKSKIRMKASLYVANYGESYNPTRVWATEYSYNGTDVSRPACSPAPCPGGGTSVSEGDGSQCYRDEDRPPPDGGGGGGDCWDCLAEPPQATYCRVRYYYWKDTNEVFDWYILWCA